MATLVLETPELLARQQGVQDELFNSSRKYSDCFGTGSSNCGVLALNEDMLRIRSGALAVRADVNTVASVVAVSIERSFCASSLATTAGWCRFGSSHIGRREATRGSERCREHANESIANGCKGLQGLGGPWAIDLSQNSTAAARASHIDRCCEFVIAGFAEVVKVVEVLCNSRWRPSWWSKEVNNRVPGLCEALLGPVYKADTSAVSGSITRSVDE